jgi:hypothetical protein
VRPIASATTSGPGCATATVDFHHDHAPDELRVTLVEARRLAVLEGSFFGFRPVPGHQGVSL